MWRHRIVALIMLGFTGLSAQAKAAYRALVLPYEETFLEGNQEIWDKGAELLSTFYGLAPHYAAILLARTRGLPAAEQLEEIFPGQRLNNLILTEYKRYLQETIPQLKTNISAVDFTTEVRKRGVKVLVYSTTDYDLVQADIGSRKLPVNFIKASSRPEIGYPPLERILSRYELPSEEVLVLGGSQYACNQAGMAGLDFALYHEMVDAKVDGERPCNINYKVNQLRDLKALLIKGPVNGNRSK